MECIPDTLAGEVEPHPHFKLSSLWKIVAGEVEVTIDNIIILVRCLGMSSLNFKFKMSLVVLLGII